MRRSLSLPDLSKRYALQIGDCKDLLLRLPPNSIDACVTDAPYEIGFLDHQWDRTGAAFDVNRWRLVLRCLKPGAYIMCFGGDKTFHRVTCAIEDAGFELTTHLMRFFADNKPATKYRLRPSFDAIILAQKPIVGDSIPANVARFGTGALRIDDCRTPVDEGDRTEYGLHNSRATPMGYKGHIAHRGTYRRSTKGRWPANVMLDEIVAAMLDEQSGDRRGMSSGGKHRNGYVGKLGTIDGDESHARGDHGGASRFFFVARATTKEKNIGVTNGKNNHASVKPLTAMRWCVRLATPKGGIVLDPYVGSGSTGCAAMIEGVSFIGMDIEPEYLDIARQRIDHWKSADPSSYP